jgi:hypothetical protein
MLRALLCNEFSFAAWAERRGKGSGPRAKQQVATHFRMLLEACDEHFAAHGSLIDLARLGRGETERQGKGQAAGYAIQAERTDEATDERGVIVPPGQGYRWGRRSDEEPHE